MISKRTMQRLQTDYDSMSDISPEATNELRFIEKTLINMALHNHGDYDHYNYIVRPSDVRIRREIYNTLCALGYHVVLDPVDAKTPDWPTGQELEAASVMIVKWWG